MVYIKKVILENFQSHKYTELEFDSGLNVIVGPSDQGKSAIIRGIKWALFNEPSGDFFIREGATECSVTVIFSNNIKVKRYRSKTKNYYYLYDSDGNELVFQGFGSKVPEEIINKISLRKVLLDENIPSLINIGEQLEGPFLLSEKNSTRANAIGRLVGVHIIDDALKDTLKDIRNLKLEKRRLEEFSEQLNNSLAEYDYLDDLIEKANKLEDIKNNIYNKQLKLNELIQKHEQLNQINDEIKYLKTYIEKLKNLDIVVDLEHKLSNKITNYRYIFSKKESLNMIENSIKYNQNLLLSLKDIDKIDYYIERLNVVIDRKEKLNNISIKYNKTQKEICIFKNIINKMEGINKIEDNLNVMVTKHKLLTRIFQLKNKLDSVNKSISIGKIYMDKLAGIESVMSIKDLIEDKYSLLQCLSNIKKNYDLILQEKAMIKNKLSLIKNEINSYLQRYREVLSRIEVCPLCLSPIDKENIENIIKNYEREEVH
jgi:exonuclease SbcC